ncbi:class I SAM-dependent methyltransferase [Hamadaea tsunoensis]|uniref:class I SAM-dependent methyltransferase n=1 Tax=Hamadaea tsunoensis TaxID=53368 RepID=UPI000427CE5A|nr:class I SAM-dependent methyltransferase [Hamadaea tsunoensis]
MLDEDGIARAQYATLDPLSVRIETHRRYSARPDDIEASVDEAVVLRDTADLLDIGCGTGSYLRRLAASGHAGRLVGVDASPAAIAALDGVPGVTAVGADAQELPFEDATFDVVTLRHMLYHVPDPGRALREARRVLRPGGTVAALVNLEHTTPLLHEASRRPLAAFGVRRPEFWLKVHSGNLPGLVGDVFGNARVHRHDNELVFDSPGPVAAYAVSCLTGYGITADDPRRDAMVAAIEAYAVALFDEESPRRDPKGYVIVTAHRP